MAWHDGRFNDFPNYPPLLLGYHVPTYFGEDTYKKYTLKCLKFIEHFQKKIDFYAVYSFFCLIDPMENLEFSFLKVGALTVSANLNMFICMHT